MVAESLPLEDRAGGLKIQERQRFTLQSPSWQTDRQGGAITRFEKGHGMPIRGNLTALRQAFKAAGVEFLDGDGVRVREGAGR
jgi:hypothetical protein